MTQAKIALIPGDGIGPEIVAEAVRILNKIETLYDCSFTMTELLMGGAAIDATGRPLPEETKKTCLESDAVLLGAVGGNVSTSPWYKLPPDLRPEKALLELRAAMDVFANLRPAILQPSLASACYLKPEIVAQGLDILMVRELVGGIYFGKRGRRPCEQGGETAFDEMEYSTYEIERIGRVAFEAAMKRSKRLTSVDKANVLETSRLWRETMHKLAAEYPEVEYSDMLVDSTAMELVRNPARFDVIVTENMFGDILSDEASMITGSIGLLPSASLGYGTRGLYEPIHGSAPDIAGQDKANPLATIASAAMLLRYSLGMEDAALAVEKAISRTLEQGWRTADITTDPKQAVLSTSQMGDKVLHNLVKS